MYILRRSLRHAPRQYHHSLPIPLTRIRNLTFQAGAPTTPDDPSASASTPGQSSQAFELVSGSSQHPFASVMPDSSSSSSSSSDSSTAASASTSHGNGHGGDEKPEGAGDTTDVVTNLPQPPPSPPPAIPWHQHPFDTHAFVTYLEKSEVEKGQAVVLMESVRDLIIWRKTRALERLLDKEDQENAAYLFRAALSELRAELSVRAKSDSLSLKQMTLGIRREIDSLEQKMKEDIQTLKHDIEMDMNNRKAETRSDQKSFDLEIEEINNKFTISLGDLRTEIESAKWDSVRRAMSLLVLFIVTGVGSTMFYTPAVPAAVEVPTKTTAVPLKDAGVQTTTSKSAGTGKPTSMSSMSTSTDDDDDHEDLDTEEKLEKLLSDKEIAVHHRRQRRRSKAKMEKPEKAELDVDRI